MNKTGILSLTLIFLFQACHEKSANQEPPAKEEKKNFFPVADYLRSEISYVDSLPLGIMKYDIEPGKRDSGYIKTNEFDNLAKEFLPEELTDSLFSKDFTETSFLDQTTQSITFTYAPINGSNSLRRVDVLASPNPGFEKVKSIYLEKTINKKDTTVVKKMFWKAKRSFQVITITQAGNQPAISSQLKVVWDDRD
jgi:hypothetical protein